MSYFENFPLIEYETSNGNIILPNITIRTDLEKYKTSGEYFTNYDIKDGESPEMLSDRIYDTPNYYFVILMFNNILDIYSQWPLTSNEVVRLAKLNYTDIYAIHHYTNEDGLIVSDDYSDIGIVPVTNLEYELNENNKKRTIKILLPSLVPSVIQQHHRLVSE